MNSSIIYNVNLSSKTPELSIVHCRNGRVELIEPYNNTNYKPVHSSSPVGLDEGKAQEGETEDARTVHIDGRGGLLLPSLCHSHIHLDKCYLLDSSCAEVRVKDGGFKEAFEGTSEAKTRFTEEDLLIRGRRVVRESVASGVTLMRCYVEVDGTVGMKCLEVAKKIKEEFEPAGICDIQIAVFAQDPLFKDGDSRNRELILRAVQSEACSVLATTPYVEDNDELGEKNIGWAIKTAIQHCLHLDFHLDFNLDAARRPLTYSVISALKSRKWNELNPGRTVLLGHCTRLSLFDGEQLRSLRALMEDRPVHFSALPRSDVYMMGARRSRDRRMEFGGHPESGARGTIDVVSWIREYGFNCSIAVNNVGNGFTPHGSPDPLILVSESVGLLQRASKDECDILMECVTYRAKAALGHLDDREAGLEVKVGNKADFVIVGSGENRAVQSAVFNPSFERLTIKDGVKVASRRCEITLKGDECVFQDGRNQIYES